MTRHFLRDDDLTPAEQAAVLDLAEQMKKDRSGWQPLAGPRAVAVLFDKPSLRTRVSFTVGIAELGGHPLVIDTQTTHIGRGETIEDVARVLTRQVAAIAWRTSGQERIEALAAAAAVPVINALTDQFHPCQILADLQTIRAHYGSLAGRMLTFLGDGSSNMAHSYLLGGATAGMHVRIGAPGGLPPRPGGGGRRRADRRADRRRGRGRDRSAGGVRRRRRDRHRRVDLDGPGKRAGAAARDPRLDGDDPTSWTAPKLALGRPGCLVLHCLPAHRGEEISADVIDGPNSVVWEQAENRLHAQKALLTWLLEQRMTTAPVTKTARHARIADILAREQVRSQEELADLLERYASVHVTQATLSRDLDELGVVRLALGRRAGVRPAGRARRAGLAPWRPGLATAGAGGHRPGRVAARRTAGPLPG